MSSKIHLKNTTDRIIDFIRKSSEAAGFSKFVLGLSGGVDSSLSAALGARAVGPENMLGIIMPYKSSSPQSEDDARSLASAIGIAVEKIDITPMVKAYFKDADVTPLRIGNKCARERMSLLFDIASRDNRLVLGTSNKTEICLGYSTWYGDAACSINPLGGLYKRDVWALADYLDVPNQIIKKSPSADLWPNQTDEDELGLTYQLADDILSLIIEKNERSIKILLETGASEETIQTVVNRLNRFAFKRRLPLTESLDGQPIPESINLK